MDIKYNHFALGDMYFNKVNVMFSHHYNSFNKFIDHDIKEYLTNVDTTVYRRSGGQYFYRYKFIFSDFEISNPKTKTTDIIYPNDARDQKLTYAAEISATVQEIQEKCDNITKEVVSKKNVGKAEKVVLVNMPIMVKSKYCSLNKENKFNANEMNKECDNDPGGFFIINGSEKVVIPQEKKVVNKAVVDEYKPGKPYKVQVNSLSNGGDSIMQVMSLKYFPSSDKNTKSKNSGVIYLFNPLFEMVNVIVLFRAMGVETDKEIIDCCCLNASESTRRQMVQILSTCIRLCVENGELLDTKEKCINHLIKNLRSDNKNKYSSNPEIAYKEKVNEVNRRINKLLLPHIQTSPRDKIRFIGYMIFKLLNYYLGVWDFDDIDSYVNKRVEMEGDLFLELFQQNFRNTMKEINSKFNRICSSDEEPISIVHMISQISQNIQNKSFYAALSQGRFGSREGVAQQLTRLTYLQELLLLREIVSPAKASSALRLYEPRMFNYTHNGMLCSMETPEHKQVGMIKQLSLIAGITINHREQVAIIKELIKDYLGCYDNDYDSSRVFLNGEWICCVKSNELNKFINILKNAKLNNVIDKYCSISYNDIVDEVFIWTDGGRFVRPTLVVKDGKSLFDEKYTFGNGNINKLIVNETTLDEFMIGEGKGLIEYIDCDEQNCAMIAHSYSELVDNEKNKEKIKDSDVNIDNHYLGMFKDFTHLEIHPLLLLGINTSTIPFVNCTSGARTILHYAQGKQGLGIYNTAYRYRNDKAFLAYHPHKPLLTTKAMKYSYYDILSPGENVIVAITAYTGFNQEDGIIMNKRAIERGLFNACYFEKFYDKASKSSNGTNDKFMKPIQKITKDYKKSNYEKLNEHGYVEEETVIENNDVIIGKVSSIAGDNKDKEWKDNSTVYKHYTNGVVDKVWHNIEDAEGYEIKKMRVRIPLKPIIGDKFSTKSAQKGTICLILNEEDMPVSENGIVPDIIFNPIGIYNRLTMGFMLELLFGKWCGLEGHGYDASGFEPFDMHIAMDKLKEYGFNEYGMETMYNGMTGVKMESQILIGPLFYLRLKHIASDKIHARYEGPKAALTRQPTEGRSRDGGLRVGTMEKDALIAHGVGSFLKEKMLDDSDIYYMRICGRCGMIATRKKGIVESVVNDENDCYVCKNCGETGEINKVAIPYAMKLLMYEIESMGVGIKLGT